MEHNSGSNRASNFKSAKRVALGRFEITSLITPELYDTKSCYQLIVPITKCENLSLGIFINVRNRFQSKKMTGYHVPCSEISLASGICYLIFTGSLTVRFDLSDYKLLVIGQVKSGSFGVT